MTTPKIRRGGLLAVAALLLGACQWGLTITPTPAGDGFTISNADLDPCVAWDGEEEAPVATDVAVAVISSVSFQLADEMPESPADIEGVAFYSGHSDEDGIFAVDVAVPDRPGGHLVMAICGVSADDIVEEGEPGSGDPGAMYVDVLEVGQGPLTVSVDKAQVEAGSPVVATFSWCRAENDLDMVGLNLEQDPDDVGLPDGYDEESYAAVLADLADLLADVPTLDVYVDGELAATVEADGRYPTGTVDVPLTLTGVGEHEIEGVCTYQTVEFDEERFAEMLPPLGPDSQDIGPAAVEYPYTLDEAPFVWDEAELVASAPVQVLAASTGAGTVAPPAAQPVVAAPSYTG